ncbi:MAG TPA: DUF4062 domain-containing protein [Verrucomicrobiae bacterium]|nr:DUF4062 domain-containing protein [Verrucomicrobiae bacterium]
MSSTPVRDASRSIRVFVSSTFRDMHAEREELVKRVFPRLRKFCAERALTLNAIDLRWGITEEQARRGDLLPVCLAEIDRCRPFFVCLLAERYGWVPGATEFSGELLSRYPWLRERIGDSITEIEVWHGALNEAGGQGMFYFRDPAYVDSLPAGEQAVYREAPEANELRELGAEEAERNARQRREKLAALKARIRGSGAGVCAGYRDPAELENRVYEDLSALIGGMFPASTEVDDLDREAAEHEAFARSRGNIYVGRPEYIRQLDEFADQAEDGKGLVVLGPPGSGKSALLARWLEVRSKSHPGELVLYHALGSTPDSADGAKMLRRLLGEFRRRLGVEIAVPGDPQGLQQAFLGALYQARERIVVVLDGLNHLEDRDGFPNLLWLPDSLPPMVRLIASALPGRALEVLRQREWLTLTVQPLVPSERRVIVTETLLEAGKALDEQRLTRLVHAEPCSNPLFLRALVEELCLFGVHERLDERITYYLEPGDGGPGHPDVEDLFDRILKRYEEDYERERPNLVRDAMSLIWASRGGLPEHELMAMLGSGDEQPLPAAYWSPLHLAAESAFMYQAGRINFFHDHIRQAVEKRYLASEDGRAESHVRIASYLSNADWIVRVRVGNGGQELPEELARFAKWTDARVPNPRRLEEMPWQLAKAGAWRALAETLAEPELVEHAWKTNRADLESYWAQLYQESPWRLANVYGDVIANPVRHPRLIDPVSSLLAFAGENSLSQKMERSLIAYYREHGPPADLARHLHSLATRLRRSGDLDAAMALHEEEGAIYRRLDDLKGLATCLDGMALVLRRQGNLDKALAGHKEAEEIGRRLDLPVMTMSALNNQALVLRAKGAPPAEIIPLYSEVESLARRLNDPWVLAHSLFSLALQKSAPIVNRSPLSDEDLRYFFRSVFPPFEEASRIAANCHFTNLEEQLKPIMHDSRRTVQQLGRRLTAQGVDLFRMGDTGRALALYREAEDAYKQIGDLEGLGIAIGEQALVFLERRDFESALTMMRREEQICRQMGDLAGLATNMINQTSVLLQSGDIDGAIGLLEKQDVELASVDDPVAKGRRLSLRASISSRRGDNAGALALLREAEKLFRTATDAEALGTCLLTEAGLLPNDPEHAEEAMRMAKEALDLAGKHGLTVLETEIRRLLDERKGSSTSGEE